MKWFSKQKIKGSTYKPWFEKKNINELNVNEDIFNKFKKDIDFTPKNSEFHIPEKRQSVPFQTKTSNQNQTDLIDDNDNTLYQKIPNTFTETPKKTLPVESVPIFYNNIENKKNHFKFRDATQDTFEEIMQSLEDMPTPKINHKYPTQQIQDSQQNYQNQYQPIDNTNKVENNSENIPFYQTKEIQDSQQNYQNQYQPIDNTNKVENNSENIPFYQTKEIQDSQQQNYQNQYQSIQDNTNNSENIPFYQTKEIQDSQQQNYQNQYQSIQNNTNNSENIPLESPTKIVTIDINSSAVEENENVDIINYNQNNQVYDPTKGNNILINKERIEQGDLFDGRIKNENIPVSMTPKLNIDRDYELDSSILSVSQYALEYTDPEETEQTIDALVSTLNQFSIKGQVVGIQRGPIITRFEFKPAPGIKVAKILGLTDDIAMALEAIRVRIEAPIPGRNTVGIEIPNKTRNSVLLGDLLNEPGFKEYEGYLPLPLGRDISGNLVVVDLTKLPHLLIAGATGSGKSVLVNSFIINFILRKSPTEIRFMLVDPKLVELSQYNDIPHLLHPVITTPKKATQALNWIVEEMERRYEDLQMSNVRDIRSYNEKINLKENIMPYIILLIDEIGDLMMTGGKEIEQSIVRISQKARAVGIHLILATQRPSVDVITALIKANCPARIALQVAQKTDSRTILDATGADELLGSGDSLFKHPSQGQLIRVQSPFVDDDEIEKIIIQAKAYTKPNYITLEDNLIKSNINEVQDELFEDAWKVIEETKRATGSYLQRALNIGYNRAAKLIEAFEAKGYIGPQDGSKAREIYGRPNRNEL